MHAGQFVGYTGPCGQSRGGVRIGELPTLAHGVSGVLWLEHAGRFCIENFNYDAQGPGKFSQSLTLAIFPRIILLLLTSLVATGNINLLQIFSVIN